LDYLIEVAGPRQRLLPGQVGCDPTRPGRTIDYWVVKFARVVDGQTSILEREFGSHARARRFSDGMQLYPLVSISDQRASHEF